MEYIVGILVVLVSALVIILILRALGAWMFRINEVINLQTKILEELKKLTHEKK
jgi:hypothetical protein